MSVRTAFDTLASDLRIFECDYFTATVWTENSKYTVVSRPNFVVVISEDGWVGKGTDFYLGRSRQLFLRDNNKDVTVLRTTPIKRVYVLEN